MITNEDMNKVLKYIVEKDKNPFKFNLENVYDQHGINFLKLDMIVKRMEMMGLIKTFASLEDCLVEINDELYSFYERGGFQG